MIKIFVLASLATPLLFGAMPARAAIEPNGLSANGLSLNGMTINGMTLNGIYPNGTHANGVLSIHSPAGDRATAARVTGVELPGLAR